MNLLQLKRHLRLHRLCEGTDGGDATTHTGADDPASKADPDDGQKPDDDPSDKKQIDPDAGKHKPTDEEAKLLKDVMAKKRENERLTTELATLKKEFDGIDANAVRKILQERQDAETRKLEEKGEWERLKGQMVDGFNKERETLSADLASKKTQNEALQKQIADLTVGSAFSQSKFVSDEIPMPVSKARVVFGSHFEFVDGKVVGYDKPAGAAERTMLVDSSGNPLDFDAALEAIVDADPDRDSLRYSKMKDGAGSRTAPKTKKPVAPAKELSAIEKVQQGLDAFLKQ
ncbi:DUF6651 domain-containing protein [Castellaniella sp.]|uniref:DUF6651 domain-containing protein n=1 Tax=Castellaniella sp. TaxID=1955812 RepID=UPI002AFF8A85|nr:DUF6651 domain-containing protein [Castellaniella sp.]